MGPNPPFIGRDLELEALRGMLNGSEPRVATLYGRRRIGKSFLIETAFAGQPTLTIEGVENRPKREQIANFLFHLSVYAGQPVTTGSPATTWRKAFHALFEQIRQKPCIIILDEFQWMANYRSEIVSELKVAWDRHLSKVNGAGLVLCGSIASFMIGKVIRSSAFYGRIDTVIHLKPFELTETAKLLTGRGVEEVLEAHMLTGGVPKYLRLLSKEPSVRLGLVNLAFRESGFLTEEYGRIFAGHFGRNPEFEAITGALAHQSYGLTRPQIEQVTGTPKGGGLSTHLADLEAAGFISSQTPFCRKSDTRIVKYFLSDAYLRFYYAFIKPALKDIKAGTNPERFNQVWTTPAYLAWRGRSFEYLCVQHARRIADLLQFSGISFTCGPYFQSPARDKDGAQIDLVFDRADHVLTLCEMKYSTSAPGRSIIEETERKANVLRAKFPRKTVQPVLISLTPPSSDLASAGYFVRTILAEELI